jgi:hypothetical protein
MRDGFCPSPTSIEPFGSSTGLVVEPVPLLQPTTSGTNGVDKVTRWWRVELTEGKYHEVRRLFAAMGGHVARLARVSFASVTLAEEGLVAGAAGLLARERVVELYRAVDLEPSFRLEVRFIGKVSEGDSWEDRSG